MVYVRANMDFSQTVLQALELIKTKIFIEKQSDALLNDCTRVEVIHKVTHHVS